MSTTVAPETAASHPRSDPWQDTVLPVVIRAVQMLAQLVATLLVAPSVAGRGLSERFVIWDAKLYADIARHGYGSSIAFDASGALTQGKEWAFYPLYPMLEGLLSRIARVEPTTAGVAVAVASSLGFSVVLHHLVLALGGSRRAGHLACFLVGLAPMAVVLQMGYAESLFLLVSGGCLLAVVRGRWGWAAALGALGCLCRPTGILVVVAMLLTGLLRSRAELLRACLASLVTGGALLAWWAVAWWRTGLFDAIGTVEHQGWGTRIDFGQMVWKLIKSDLLAPRELGLGVVVLAILAAHLLALVPLFARRAWWPLAAYGLAVAGLVIGTSTYWHSKPRLMLAGLVLAAPLAIELDTVPRRLLVPMLVAGFCGALWFGGFMLNCWLYAM